MMWLSAINRRELKEIRSKNYKSTGRRPTKKGSTTEKELIIQIGSKIKVEFEEIGNVMIFGTLIDNKTPKNSEIYLKIVKG